MANFFVYNHRFPRNPQSFTINVSKYVSVGGEENPNFKPSYPSAEPYWKVVIYTSGKDINGKEVGPVVGDILGPYDNVNDFVQGKIKDLCSLIDWTSQGQFAAETDAGAPIIVEQKPFPGEEDVSINSEINIVIREPLPGNGIDISTLVFKVNGITVNPKIVGNKYEYTISYGPRPLYY